MQGKSPKANFFNIQETRWLLVNVIYFRHIVRHYIHSEISINKSDFVTKLSGERKQVNIFCWLLSEKE